MQPPEELRALIERCADEVPFAELKRAVQVMSDAYRQKRGTAAVRLSGRERIAAYLVTRAPATYAAARRVLEEVRAQPQSVLDVGAGAGSASLAARELFDVPLTLIEQDHALARAGRELLPDAEWIEADFRRIEPLPERDLAIASYVLAEQRDAAAALRLWKAARQTLVLIEPGTPEHFAFVLDIRDRLIAAGAHLLAPCPRDCACPLPSEEWCHFATRIERTSLHRRLKEGALGYEDEKFSYMIFSRDPVEHASGRIIRRPEQRPGLITLEVCRGDRIETEQARKSDRERFRKAKRSSWGDVWE